jgi:integrase
MFDFCLELYLRMRILANAEKQREPSRDGGWQEMARRRYQKGSIRKRGRRGPVWELLWREDVLGQDGRLHRRLCCKILGLVRELTLRQARKLAEEYLRPLNQGVLQPRHAITFQQFVETVFAPNALPTLKLSTQKRYRRTLNNHLLPAFGERRLCDIGTLDLQRFVLQKMDSGLGWAAADHLRNLMSRIFATAKKWQYFRGENPASAVELPEKKPVRQKLALSPQQARQLLLILRDPARMMLHLALLTGLRVGEILGLRWQDVDFATGEIRVEQAYYRGEMGSPKTKGSRRTLPMPESLKAVLMRFYRDSGPLPHESLIFRTRGGNPFNDTNLLHRHLKPAGKVIGAPWLSWHSLRRTHATWFQAAGGSLREAQAQMGHTKLSTTLEIYTIPLPAQQRVAVEKLAEVLLTNVDELEGNLEPLELSTEQIQ